MLRNLLALVVCLALAFFAGKYKARQEIQEDVTRIETKMQETVDTANEQLKKEKKDAEINALQARYNAIKNGAKLTDVEKKKVPKKANGGLIKGPGTGRSDSIRATLGYAGGGSIRVSDGEFIVKAASVSNYGVDKMNAVNNGTATISTDSGGTVYNVSMTVNGGNSNPQEIAKLVMKEFENKVNKNNKSNRVSI